jgi:hypothetical protein
MNYFQFFKKINVGLKNVHQTSGFGTFYDDSAMNYEFFKNKISFKNTLSQKKTKKNFPSKFASGNILSEAKLKSRKPPD